MSLADGKKLTDVEMREWLDRKPPPREAQPCEHPEESIGVVRANFIALVHVSSTYGCWACGAEWEVA